MIITVLCIYQYIILEKYVDDSGINEIKEGLMVVKCYLSYIYIYIYIYI